LEKLLASEYLSQYTFKNKLAVHATLCKLQPNVENKPMRRAQKITIQGARNYDTTQA
jgi:hypothetical protein